MLHAAVNLEDAIRGTRHANRRLGLHVGVLDGLRLKFFLDDEISLFETIVNIATSDDVRVDDVRAVMFMHERCVRQHRRFGIQHGGQRFGVHLHQLRRVNRDRARLRDDDGDDIAVVTNLVVGKDAVVADDLAETILAWHILSRQHANHAGNFLGGTGVNRDDARVNAIGIRRRGVEHVGELEVVRELRLARDLGVSVIAPAFGFRLRHQRAPFFALALSATSTAASVGSIAFGKSIPRIAASTSFNP